MSGESWFFQKPSDVLFVDEDLLRVGINKENPAVDLDVQGTIEGSNVVAENVIQGSNVLALNTIQGSNVLATNVMQGLVVNAASNLMINGFSLYDPCPSDTNDWDGVIPFKDDKGFIHESWIRKPTNAVSIFEDLYTLVTLGVDVYTVIKTLSDLIQGRTFADAVAEALPGAIAGAAAGAASAALTQALSDLFDNAEGDDNDAPKISWFNLKQRPLANIGNDIGIKGNLITNAAGKLQIIGDGAFTTDTNNNTKFGLTGTTGAATVIDFSTLSAYLNTVNVKDGLYINSNISFTPSNVVIETDDVTIETSSNVIINGTRLWQPDSLTNALDTDDVYCSAVIDKLNRGSYASGLYLEGFRNNLRFINKGINSSNEYYWNESKILQDARGFQVQTMPSAFQANGAPSYTTQMQIDSNGSLYVNKSMTMCNKMRLMANVPARFINGEAYSSIGELRLDDNYMRFIYNRTNLTTNSNTETIAWSINSNGMFFKTRPSIYGYVEPIAVVNPGDPLGAPIVGSNFARLDYAVNTGLVWGTGY